MTGPASLLASLLPRKLRDVDEARAACVWFADVGEALIYTAGALKSLAAQQAKA